ncbi:MAG: hypothetical protein E7J40_22305, partial [Escherichia coli]|nr:hypothetical protein [Escherichia coli]
ELLLCHGMVCVVGRIRDLILQLSKSSIYSTKPLDNPKTLVQQKWSKTHQGNGFSPLILSAGFDFSDTS